MSEPVLAGLLLAAGGSERLGQPKQLLSLHGESLVRRSAVMLLEQAADVLVVTGAEADSVREELRDLPVKPVHNGDWRAGMGGSIAAGMQSLGDEPDGVLIMLCDQWCIDRGDLDSLFAAWQTEPSLITAAKWGENFGAPAIFPKSLFHDLRGLHGERGAKAIIGRQTDIRFVDMPHAGIDLDTPEDLRTLDPQGRGFD